MDEEDGLDAQDLEEATKEESDFVTWEYLRKDLSLIVWSEYEHS